MNESSGARAGDGAGRSEVRAEGLSEVRAEGRADGRAEIRNEGRAEIRSEIRNDGRGSGRREGWRDALARAPFEALIEELRERDALKALAVAPAPVKRRAGSEGDGVMGGSGGAGAAKPKPPVAKKRTTAEQWALVAATDGDLVDRVRTSQRAIYGEDGRVDWSDAPLEVRSVGASVAALFARRDVVEVGGRYHVMTRPFGEVYFLAHGEAFADQPCGAFGTAWVIDEHHMVTAGHCVPADGPDGIVCVFGFAVGADGEVATSFDAEQVAFPSAVLSSHQLAEDGDGDWAVLRFEGALPAPPLRLRSGEVAVGEPLWMAGYPCGIPLKYAPGALVTRHKNDDRFYATLDAFAGNSGSPVLDEQQQVVGILVRGAEDWQPRRDSKELRKAQRYPQIVELGEEVMKLERFAARRPAGSGGPPGPGVPVGGAPVVGVPATTTARGMVAFGRPAGAPRSSVVLSSSTSASASGWALGTARTAAMPAPEGLEESAAAVVAALPAARLAPPPPTMPPPLRVRAGTDRGLAAPIDAHALLIQMSRYPQMPLPEVRDAEDLAAALADPELCHYPPANISLLREGEATREGILAALRQLAESAGEDSTVLIYVSGHVGLRGGTTYLLPFDCDREAMARTAITEQQLIAALAPLRATKVLLIFDCCHAGQFSGSPDDSTGIAVAPPVRPGLPDALQAELVRGRGWAVMTSARPGQRSRVPADARNGVFAEHLLDGLRGGRPSDDGYLRVMELFEYLQPRVTRDEPRQQPQLHYDRSDSFAIGRHRGGAVGVVPRTDDGFRYHALLCYAPADAAFVRDVLVPPLTAAGLVVATTHDVAPPGLHRVVSVERGVTQARCALVVVSQALLELERGEAFGERDELGSSDGVVGGGGAGGASMGAGSSVCRDHSVLHRKDWDLRNRRSGLVPIFIEDPDLLRGAPAWLAELEGVRLGEAAAPHGESSGAVLEELVRTLEAPAPRRG